jgi:hypothetical protein
LEYLSPFLSIQKLYVVDKKRYNIHLLERLNGDGKDEVSGPLFLWHESNWSEQEFADALFKPPSKRFLELQPPFLKFHRQAREIVDARLEELNGQVPKGSIYDRYLVQDPIVSEYKPPKAAKESEETTRFQRLKARLKHFWKSFKIWLQESRRILRGDSQFAEC